ncbi:antibiotic biosynthesis monooxygenase [Sinomonas sp. R1AF57]|jgi:quinol monooxygenase YgiN|nr:antibiotic biosynthesis monooxygenase [Sinomonas sp. R1AF57]
MPAVHLRGQLICRDSNEAALVVRHLPRHVALTRAEAGCVSFRVEPSADPLVWEVEELFSDPEAFAVHQERVAGSEWGRVTAAIERRYTVEGASFGGT